MEILETNIDPDSPTLKQNAAYHADLVRGLREATATVRLGGGEEAVKKHRARGKLLARERIEHGLLDPGAPFLEFSTLAANGMYSDGAPGAGIVTGIGAVHGQECVIVANDATVAIY